MLTITSPTIAKSIELTTNMFGITQAVLLSPDRSEKYVAARHALWHGLSTSGRFGVNELALCFGVNHQSIQHAVRRVNNMICKPTSDRYVAEICELSAFIKKHVLENDTTSTPFTRYKRFEQIILPVLRPDWSGEVAVKCAHSGVSLKEGFLIQTNPEKYQYYPPELVKILKVCEWDAPYVWVKPKIVSDRGERTL